MAVSFRLENRAGPVEESVRVLVDGNDAGGVVVHATVIGGIEIASERAGEDVVAQGDVRDVSLSLVGSSDLGPWKPVGVSVGPDDAPTQTLDVPFTFELRSVVDDPARRYSVRLQIPGVSTIGRRRVRVRVRTDGVRPLEPRAIIGFDVVPVVRSTTSILYLGVISDGAPRPARVRFLSANRRYPFNLRGARVIDVESPDAESDYLAIVDRDEIGYYADVTWKGRDRTPRALKATLVVETNRSECPSIQVALVGTVPIPSAPAPQSTSPAR